MQKYANSVQDPLGNAIGLASVSIYTDAAHTTLATLYLDNGITPTSNPLTTNSLGEFSFYAADGRYYIAVSKTGITSQSLDDVILFDPTASTSAASINVIQSGTATPSDVQTHLRNISVFASSYATPDGVTNASAGLVLALAAVPTGGSLILNATSAGSTYYGVLSVRRSDVSILIPQGVTLKMPAGTPAAAVLELGDTASGNGAAAYNNINVVVDGWLDGNKANVTAPTGDITAHGFIATNISKSYWRVKAKNCHNAGFIFCINSNYNRFSAYVESCGNATHTGPGFDVNSSSYCIGDAVSKDCYSGARVLDNCFGNNVRVSVNNSTKDGFIYNNQSVNSSSANNFDVAVYTAGQHGLNIGENCTNSNIRATVYNATNSGARIGDGTAHPSSNNNIDLITSNSGDAGLFINTDAHDNTIRHQSYLDGRTGAQGSVFAIDVNGNRNKLTVDLIDSATWQVRGIAIRSGATDNEVLSYSYTNTADPLNDAGTRTKFNTGHGRGADIASASTITVPFMGTVFHVTGTTGITGISSARPTGIFTLLFEGTLTVTDGSNLKLSGNFSATADDMLTGFWDGTNFYETARSNN